MLLQNQKDGDKDITSRTINIGSQKALNCDRKRIINI